MKFKVDLNKDRELEFLMKFKKFCEGYNFLHIDGNDFLLEFVENFKEYTDCYMFYVVLSKLKRFERSLLKVGLYRRGGR
ncbi:MAG: hypothetical protein RMJ67_06340 [Elusimicrobiota bacterium]|nr:hypothetical protein [Endomicrobiia bacterium]MDW8166112.1 hypothetical protein [Elusimicrobiota bacterium]